jgi:hypothetical protein
MAYTSVERGVGDSVRRLILSKANRNFTTQYFQSVHASGDIRIQYLHDRFTSTGGGEVYRGVAEAYGLLCAAGATINAAHFTGRVGTASTVSGALNAVRATLEVGGTTPTPGGTLAVLQLDSNVVTGATLGAKDAFMRVTNSGATPLANFINFEVAGDAAHNSGEMVIETAALAASDLTRLVRCKTAEGTLYLVATTHTPD